MCYRLFEQLAFLHYAHHEGNDRECIAVLRLSMCCDALVRRWLQALYGLLCPDSVAMRAGALATAAFGTMKQVTSHNLATFERLPDALRQRSWVSSLAQTSPIHPW